MSKLIIQEKVRASTVQNAIAYCMNRLLVPETLEFYKTKILINKGLEDEVLVSFKAGGEEGVIAIIENRNGETTEEPVNRPWFRNRQYTGNSYVVDIQGDFQRRFNTANGLWFPNEYEFNFAMYYSNFGIIGEESDWAAEKVAELPEEEIPMLKDFLDSDTVTYQELYGNTYSTTYTTATEL